MADITDKLSSSNSHDDIIATYQNHQLMAWQQQQPSTNDNQ